MAAKKYVRGGIGYLPLFLQILSANLISCFESVVQWLRVIRLKRQGMKEFVVPVNKFDGGMECHILASGWSLNHSYVKIDRSKSFVIGFNFSFLKCKDPDLHFVENSSIKNLRFFTNTVQLYWGLKRFNVFSSSKVVFKNLSELKNSMPLVGMLYSDKAFFIKDRHFRIFGGKAISPTITRMCSDDKVLPQAISSVVGLILLAKTMGFKKIIVHGLDFYGPHFYGADVSEIIFNGGLIPQPLNSDEIESDLHKTAVGENGVGVISIIKVIKEELKIYNVDVFAASEVSPSVDILGLSS